MDQIIREMLSKRIVLVTGKGGVGRSSVTAAIATVAARAGKRVLVTEISDTARGTVGEYSALANLFGLAHLPLQAAQIAPGISGAQLLSHRGQELFLASILRTAVLAKAALSSEALRRLLDAAPSFREMGVFFHFLTYLRERLSDGSPKYDLLILDMPATGHTLALTGLPEILLRLITRGPIAEGLREGQTYLRDPRLASAYVVTLPETLPVSEAAELIEGLEKTKMHVAAVLVNRVPEDPFTESQRTGLAGTFQSARVQGASTFFRIKESHEALSRVRHLVKAPVLVVPEAAMPVANDARQLVSFLAGALS